jgi:hypothetical protein
LKLTVAHPVAVDNNPLGPFPIIASAESSDKHFGGFDEARDDLGAMLASGLMADVGAVLTRIAIDSRDLHPYEIIRKS